MEALGFGLLGAGLGVDRCMFAVGGPEEGACAFNADGPSASAGTGLFVTGAIISVAAHATVIAGIVEWSRGAWRLRSSSR